MPVYYLIYEDENFKTDLRIREDGKWLSVLEDSSLCRIKSGNIKKWLYPDEDSGWPGFFEELFRVSGQKNAEIYFSGTINELEIFEQAAELFTKKSGREILVRSSYERSLKELKKLCLALYDWLYTDHKTVDEAEIILKASFTEVLKQINSMYTAKYGADDLLCDPDEREEYLGSVIRVFCSYCDHAAYELTLAYTNEWAKLLSENYKKDVLFPDEEIFSWNFTKPRLKLQTPEYIKDYLEISTGWRLDEITKTMPEMYGSKIMQCRQLLIDQVSNLGVLIRRKLLQ